MRGYLQRIAASAMQPVSRVHPVVRPLFADSREDMPAMEPPGDFPTRPATERKSESIGSPAAAPKGLRDAPAISAEPPRARRREPEAAAPMEHKEPEAYRTLIEPRAEHEPADDDAPASPPEADSSPGAEPQVFVASRTVEVPGKTPAEHLPAARADLRSAVAAGLRTGARRRSAAAPAASPEPDQIEIHIGRIEITAVPPAQPSPAPKPARMSLNLDEYLKRRR